VNIQLLSDLHLESHPHFVPQPAPGAELLVLAGDIGSYQNDSALTRLNIEDFGLSRFSPLPESEGGANWPTPVLYLPGNHEYDGQEFDLAHQRLRNACARWGLQWLEREVWVSKGVRFVGCTLWTDFDAIISTRAQTQTVTVGEQLVAREKACRAANYSLKRHHALLNGQPMMADAVRELGLQSQAWLLDALSKPFDGPTVVVTHFAPSLRSADVRYGLTPGTAGFCNALDHLLPLANLWLHGHVHCALDYTVGSCRVVANPLGYLGKGEQAAFKLAAFVTVPAVGA
jgi:Calcineurin-like phosphoesterase